MKYKEWNEIKKEFLDFLRMKENRRKLAFVLLASIVFTGILWLKDSHTTIRYLVDAKGNLKGFIRSDLNNGESIPLVIELQKGDTKVRKEIILSLKGEEKGNAEKEKNTSEEENESTVLEQSIRKIRDQLEAATGKKVILPEKDENGAAIRWNRVHTAGPLRVFMIPLMYLLFLYAGRNEKAKNLEKARINSVLRGLPSFCDQLLLMMNCGLIFRDAFGRIATGYERHSNPEDYFTEIIIDTEERSKRGNESVIKLLTERAEGLENRSFARLINLLKDNQQKGIDITLRLRENSQTLWEERKQAAVERGKLAETKLALPLAMLLITLIIITAVPAMLQVNGI